MPRPLLRVPYTDALPPARIRPPSVRSLEGASEALAIFLSAPSSPTWKYRNKHELVHKPPVSSPQPPSPSSLSSLSSSPLPSINRSHGKTLLLTGAGISVASGLADYRGTNGTYTLNRTYRPIYFNEFCESHEARKRYWARSFLGWTSLERARPNEAHTAVGRLGELGVVGGCVTQNVDSFHPLSHPHLPTLELHGFLRSLVCLSCHTSYPRDLFQQQLSALNPAWSTFLAEMRASGALDTENPEERKKRGFKTNPDGDADIPNAPYTTFRYPACPTCLARNTATTKEGSEVKTHVDADGAWTTKSTGGVLKPAVIMFGESIPATVKTAAEEMVDTASRLLVVGSSLATYSAWRLVRRAQENGMPIGIVNIGGVRGEEKFFVDVPEENDGRFGLRCEQSAKEVLTGAIALLEKS